jgi:hypothetical protein
MIVADTGLSSLGCNEGAADFAPLDERVLTQLVGGIGCSGVWFESLQA